MKVAQVAAVAVHLEHRKHKTLAASSMAPKRALSFLKVSAQTRFTISFAAPQSGESLIADYQSTS
jgi:hypothetical protein